MSDTHPSISRRSIAKGAAWTLPVLSVAAAAPSLAASPPADPVVTSGPGTFDTDKEGTGTKVQFQYQRGLRTEDGSKLSGFTLSSVTAEDNKGSRLTSTDFRKVQDSGNKFEVVFTALHR